MLRVSHRQTTLTDLPNELLLHMMGQFLDLKDLWRLLQVSRLLRCLAIYTIQHCWKIKVVPSPDTTMKIQCRAALIALEALSCQMATQTRTAPFYAQLFGEQHDSELEQLLEHPNAEEDDKQFQQLLQQEDGLHQRIIRGISSYKHKYVLIEDIDIRNRIRSAVDVIFHHAVFVAAVSRLPVRVACTHASSRNRALAAVMVRLLNRLDVAFPACCREITFTLADNVKAFLEYTGYRLLATSPASVNQNVLYPWVFGPACQSQRACGDAPPPPSVGDAPSASRNLLVTLHSISACFDLMGAAFTAKILNESHVEGAVRRTCELLSDDQLRWVKRALLVDLLEGWLNIKRGLATSELCRWVRQEIEKCDPSPPSAGAVTASLAVAGSVTSPSSLSLSPNSSSLTTHHVVS